MFDRRLWTTVALALTLAACATQPSTDLETPMDEAYTIGKLTGNHPLPSAMPIETPDAAAQTDGLKVASLAKVRAGLRSQAFRPMAVPAGVDVRVRLKVLLVTATASESGFEAMQVFLKRVGVPFDTLVASTQDLTAATLESEPGLGNYQGIILTTNNLGYTDSTGAWVSAFTQAEWDLLAEYERSYRVRQATLYTYPDAPWGVSGLEYTGYADTNNTVLNTTLTVAGRSVFSELNPTVTVPIRYAWTYLGRAVGNAVPLLTTATGGVIVATNTTTDGRENIAVTAPHNTYLTHSLMLNYGLIRWVTKGVFLGDRRMYFAAHADDYFIDNDVWDPATKTNRFLFRLRATDVRNTITWQTRLRQQNPLWNTFVTDMAFNGDGYIPNLPQICDPNAASTDKLSAYTKCARTSFRWINHTFTHIYIDDTTTKAEMDAEIGDNITAANNFGVNASIFDPKVLVTGNHSGLGYLDEATPPNNRGKSRSSVPFIQSAVGLGLTDLASNSSAPTTAPICTSTVADCNQNNPSPNQGLWLPANLPANNILLQPRFPTNLFYNVTRSTEWVSEYNTIYRSYWGRDLTYDEIMNFEVDQAFNRLMTFSVNPTFFHQSNMRQFAIGTVQTCLMCDFIDRLAKKYSSTFSVPVVNPSMTSVGSVLRNRAAFDAAQPSAILNKTAGTLTVSANSSAALPLTVPVSHPNTGSVYGPDKSLSVTNGTTLPITGQ